jgi:hypothetical protein
MKEKVQKNLFDLKKQNSMNKIYFCLRMVQCIAIHYDWILAIKTKHA